MFRLLAPAKINLFLHVGQPRADGFHPLCSWFVTVGLFDTLEFERMDGPGVCLMCEDPAVPTGEQNLVVRAAAAMLPRGAGVRIHLSKNIPMASGLGGGSSDAATTLVGMRALFGLPRDLDAIASTLGSDVNFFLHGPSALCTGRGELVTPHPAPMARAALLLFPNTRLSTLKVFRRFDELQGGVAADLNPPPLTSLSTRVLLRRLTNDLQPPAFDLAPELGPLRREAERRLERPVMMSGSGSTLFTLFDSQSEAESALRNVSDLTRTMAVPLCPELGPVPAWEGVGANTPEN